MALEHIILQSDTLQSLATQFLGDPTRWQEIVDYNGLDAPYISHDPRYKGGRFGSGYVTVTRATARRAITVPAGARFRTKPAVIGGMVKTFEATEAVEVPIGVTTFYVHVQSTIAGSLGNAYEATVTEAGSWARTLGITLTLVTNVHAFEGGSDGKVLVPGNTFYLPVDDSIGVLPRTTKEQLERIGGEDFWVPAGDDAIPADRYGDLGTISGLANIEQALYYRFITEKGDLALHPEYGTNLSELVGSARVPFTDRLVELEIYDALSFEDRIQDAEVTELNVVGTSIYLKIEGKPAYESNRRAFDFTLNFGREATANV